MRLYPKYRRLRHEPSIDALPESASYPDTGCEVSPSCLRCPLPQCKYDDPIWYQQYRRQGRDRQVMAVHRAEGATVLQHAQRFGLSQRTIHRALRRAQLSPVLAEAENVALSA